MHAQSLLFVAQGTAEAELLVIDRTWREWTVPSYKELQAVASLHQVHQNS